MLLRGKGRRGKGTMKNLNNTLGGERGEFAVSPVKLPREHAAEKGKIEGGPQGDLQRVASDVKTREGRQAGCASPGAIIQMLKKKKGMKGESEAHLLKTQPEVNT